MFAHTGEFPRFIEAMPSLNRPKAHWIAFILVSAAILSMAIRSPVDVVPVTSRTAPAPGTVLSFARRASHEGRYFAEVVETSTPPVVGAQQTWDVEKQEGRRGFRHRTRILGDNRRIGSCVRNVAADDNVEFHAAPHASFRND